MPSGRNESLLRPFHARNNSTLTATQISVSGICSSNHTPSTPQLQHRKAIPAIRKGLHPLSQKSAIRRRWGSQRSAPISITLQLTGTSPHPPKTRRCARCCLYRQVLHVNLPDIKNIDWAKKSEHVPEVFTPEEARRVLSHLTGTPKLVAGLLYGCGLRVNEALSLRIKDIDFGYKQITVHEGKGAKDRRVMLPQSLMSRCRHKSSPPKRFRHRMPKMASVCPCPMRWPKSIQTLPSRLAGDMSSPQHAMRSIRAPASSSAITCCPTAFRRPSRSPSGRPASSSTPAAIPFGTASPRTCSKPTTIFGRCRNCWATKTCALP